MSRSKKNKDRQDAGFRNHPFKNLKGFPAAGTSSSGEKRAHAREEPDDGDELFRRAMNGAKPLHQHGDDQERAAQPGPPAVQRPERTAAVDQQLFLDAMRTIGAAAVGTRTGRPEEEEGEEERRSTSRRMRRLRKGVIRIGQELDLHGFLKDEAVRRLEHFIAAAAARGLEAVLVITGKGVNSPDGPVLQGAVAQWLRGPGARFAAEFHPAPRDLGGSGAYVVFLRRM
jgi:DNA-nicking Smr family endonuclease